MANNFRDALNEPNDDLSNFDTAGGDDLSAFDAATGETHIPAGVYTCCIIKGELAPTNAGKLSYLLTFDVSNGPHAGVRLWRRYMLQGDNTAATRRFMNVAKNALVPLGFRTKEDLHAPFPRIGRTITVKALVTVREWQGSKRNDVERFEVTDDRTAPPNPNAVDLDQFPGGEGGTR